MLLLRTAARVCHGEMLFQVPYQAIDAMTRGHRPYLVIHLILHDAPAVEKKLSDKKDARSKNCIFFLPK
jgi:hypothetical protein